MKKTLPCFFMVIAILAGCKKSAGPSPAGASPSYTDSIARSHTWSGSFVKALMSNTNPGLYNYNTTATDTTIPVTENSDGTMSVSAIPVRLKFAGIDSATQTVTYDSTWSGNTASLVYYYGSDSLSLSETAYVISEYGSDDPYIVTVSLHAHR